MRTAEFLSMIQMTNSLYVLLISTSLQYHLSMLTKTIPKWSQPVWMDTFLFGICFRNNLKKCTVFIIQQIRPHERNHSNHLQKSCNRQQAGQCDLIFGKRWFFQDLERLVFVVYACSVYTNYISLLNGVPIGKRFSLYWNKQRRYPNH